MIAINGYSSDGRNTVPVMEYLVWWLADFYRYSIQEQIAEFSYADTSLCNCHEIWYSLFPYPPCERKKNQQKCQQAQHH